MMLYSIAGAYTAKGLIAEPGCRFACVAMLKPRLTVFADSARHAF